MKGRKVWWRWALALLAASLLGVCGIGFQQVQQLRHMGQVIYQPRSATNLPTIDPASDPVLGSVARPGAVRYEAVSYTAAATSKAVGNRDGTVPKMVAASFPSAAPSDAAAPTMPLTAQPPSQVPAVDSPAYPASPAAASPAAASPVAASPVAANTAAANTVAAATAPAPVSRAVRILILGNDQDDLGKGRSDVMMVARLDPQQQLLTLVNIPRDLRLNVPNYGLHKVNAAYAYGGVSLSARTLEIYLGVPFEHYLEISQRGLRQIVDLLGGVQVQVPFDFVQGGVSFRAGPDHMDGARALLYVRMRKSDPLGDLGRNARQQQVLLTVLQDLSRLPAAQWPGLLRSLQNDLRTDLGLHDLVGLRSANMYITDPARQRPLKLEVQNLWLDNVAYLQISDDQRRALYLTLR